MKKLKYLIFLSIIFLSFNVFADTTYDMTSRITSPVNFPECGVGSYTGVELNGSTNCWNTNTRNYGALSRIYFNLPAPTGTTFEPDSAYRLSLYMATNDWRNNFGSIAVRPGSDYTNNFVDSFTFVSRKQVNITFTVPYGGSTTYQTLWVNLPATNTNTLITGETNWNLSKITLTKLTSGSGGGSTTPSGPSTGFDDTAIINNANENTQDIINNNNTNTQDIINNNNANTQEIVNSIDNNFKSCSLGSNLFNKTNINNDYYLNSSGVITSTSGWFVTDYIPISPDSTYEISGTTITGGSNLNLCFYTSSKSLISCIPHNDYVPPKQITTPSNAYYFADSVYNADINTYSFKKLNCSNKLDNINDSINNSDVDNGVGTGFFDDFTSEDFGLSQIITIPLNTIQGLTSKTCVPLRVPIPFTNSNIDLPCMTEIYETKFPSIYNLWKIVTFGIIAYLIAIDIFHIVKGFKDPESDKVEVLDL